MTYFTKVFSIILFLSLTACGGSKGKKDDENKGFDIRNRVDWAGIPSEYNPDIEEVEFELLNAEKIETDIFGFDDDVEVLYNSNIPQDRFLLRMYTVYKGTFSKGRISSRLGENTISVQRFGSYQCSIEIKNGSIRALDGGCYIRLQVIMPAGAEVEVYNVGTLLTKKFFAMSTEEFIRELSDIFGKDNKFEVVENYLSSYRGVSRNPRLSTFELETVLKEFTWADDRMIILKKLHTFVTDRRNLLGMIESVFSSSWDRDEARAIVGL